MHSTTVAARFPDSKEHFAKAFRSETPSLRWTFVPALDVSVVELPSLKKPDEVDDQPLVREFQLPEVLREHDVQLRLISRERCSLGPDQQCDKAEVVAGTTGVRLRPAWICPPHKGSNVQARFFTNTCATVEIFRASGAVRIMRHAEPALDKESMIATLRSEVLFLGTSDAAMDAFPGFREAIGCAADKLYCRKCNHAHYYHLGKPPLMTSISPSLEDDTHLIQRVDMRNTQACRWWIDSTTWTDQKAEATRYPDFVAAQEVFWMLTKKFYWAYPA